MKTRYFIALFVLSINCLVAQNFVGSIEFKFYTLNDTSLNTYWIKDNMVKLDQLNKKGDATEGSFIFDLKAENIKFLSTKRKIWGKQKTDTPTPMKGKCEVTKAVNTKKICGYTCEIYVVKNIEENTSISYWIAQGGFDFFGKMMKLWARKDKQAKYFSFITNLPAGSMPLLSEETTINDGKAVSKLEATVVNKKDVKNSTFEIPAGYTKFD